MDLDVQQEQNFDLVFLVLKMDEMLTAEIFSLGLVSLKC